jgi:putative redox protein
MQLVGRSGTGHGLVLDTPVDAGGDNTGPTPMELLLLAHAGCTAMDVVAILKDKMRKPMTGLEVKVEGQRAERPPKVYTRVDLTYLVRGAGLEVKDVERAIQLSIDTYCSVSVMMSKTASLGIRYQLLDDDGRVRHEGSVQHGGARGDSPAS